MTANTSVGAQPLYERIAEHFATEPDVFMHDAWLTWHMVGVALLREAAEALRNAEKNLARYQWLAADGDRAKWLLNEYTGHEVEAYIDTSLGLSTAKADD